MVIVTVGLAAFLLHLFVPIPEAMQLNDPANDVLVSIGSNYPNAVDITGATLDVSQDKANLTIRTNAQSINANQEGTLTYETVLVLENKTDAVKTYDLLATLNSTGISCSIRDVEEETSKNCTIYIEQNELFISTPIGGKVKFEQVEWSITSTYEEKTAGVLTANAFDFAPDQGTHTTIAQPLALKSTSPFETKGNANHTDLSPETSG